MPNEHDRTEAPQDDTYDPSTVQVNRAREQGNGVGQSDIDEQRDPTGARSAQQYSRGDEPDGVEAPRAADD